MVRRGARLVAHGQAAAPTIVVTAALLLGFQAIRVFATHTFWVLGETSSREVLALVTLGGFAATVLAWPLVWGVGLGPARAWSLRLLAIGATIGQISTAPWVDLGAGLAGLVGLGWFIALLLPALGSPARIGLALALLIDVVVRVSFITVDAPFAHEPAAAAIVAVAVAIVAIAPRWAATWPASLPTFRNAWPLTGLGPGLAIFMLLSGNFGQINIALGGHPGTNAILTAAFTSVGLLGTWVVVSAPRTKTRLPFAISGLLLLVGFLLWDARTPLAGYGALIVATAIPVVLAGIIPDQGLDKRALASAMCVTVGLVFFVALLFVFYSFYGPAWVLRFAVAAVLATLLIARVFRASSKTLGMMKSTRPLLVPMASSLLILIPAIVVNVSGAMPDGDAKALPGSLTVITYNIRQGFGTEGRFDLEAVARTLEDHPADVVALQEVGRGWVISGAIDTLTWLSQRLDLPYAYGGNATGLWGNAVLSRLPLRSVNHHFKEPGRIPRGVLEVEIDVGDRTYTILNTHLDHEVDGDLTRELQVEAILNVWGGRTHTAVVGDLNALPNERPIQHLLAEGFRDPDVGGPPTFPDNHLHQLASPQDRDSYIATGDRIDYVLHTPDMVAAEVLRPFTGASDHEPVWVRLVSETTASR